MSGTPHSHGVANVHGCCLSLMKITPLCQGGSRPCDLGGSRPRHPCFGAATSCQACRQRRQRSNSLPRCRLSAY
eukprot:120644-Pyramimonas_sp.AAC.1